MLGLGNLGELVPELDVARAVDAVGAVDRKPEGAAELGGVGVVGRVALGIDQGRVGPQRPGEPGEVVRALLAEEAQHLVLVVVVLAAELLEVGVERLGVVGGHDELAARLGVAGLLPLRGLLADQDLGALLVGRDGRVGAGVAEAQDHHVVLVVPLHVVGRRLGGVNRGREGRSGNGGRPQGRTPHKLPARDCTVHRRTSFLIVGLVAPSRRHGAAGDGLWGGTARPTVNFYRASAAPQGSVAAAPHPMIYSVDRQMAC